VLEEVQRDFTPTVFSAAFVASVTADVITRWLTGQTPVFNAAMPPTPELAALPLFLVMGVVAGILGILYNRGLLASVDLFERTRRWPFGLQGVIVGAGVGVVAWFAPATVGGGYHLLDDVLAGKLTLSLLVGCF